MFLKILGSIAVIASSSLAGFYYGNLETYCIGDLSEMKKALAILKSEIEYSMNPLPQAFLNISLRVKKPVGKIFALACENLKLYPDLSMCQIWENSVKGIGKETYFNNEDIEQFISFGKTLGYLDTDMQITNIRIMTEYIDGRVGELGANREKNKKMFNSLGVLGGLLAVVILV